MVIIGSIHDLTNLVSLDNSDDHVFKTNKKYDKIIAIAVLHHLETVQEQFSAIENLIKCLNYNGKLFEDSNIVV